MTFLHSIGHILGEQRAIGDIEPIAIDRDLLDLLLANGIRHYRESNRTPPELAAQAMRVSLDQSGIHPRQIDAVVWSTTSFQQRSWYTDDVSRTLASLDMWTAVPVGVTLSECGNLCIALDTARHLIRDGCKHVMVVVADCCPEPALRLVPPSLGILSDGAACGIVSAEAGEFELLASAQFANHRPRIGGKFPASQSLLFNAEGVKRAVTSALERAGLSANEVSSLITNNLALSVLEMFCSQAGLPISRLFTETIQENGHVYAADGLINLAQSRLEKGQTLMLLTNGNANWGAYLMRKCR